MAIAKENSNRYKVIHKYIDKLESWSSSMPELTVCIIDCFALANTVVEIKHISRWLPFLQIWQSFW